MSSLRNLTKHPIPDKITEELITSVTVSTLNKWIVEKGIGWHNFRKAKRSEKEAALLRIIAADMEAAALEADDVSKPVVDKEKQSDNEDLNILIASAIEHINKKMKTNNHDDAVRNTVMVSTVCCYKSKRMKFFALNYIYVYFNRSSEPFI